MVFFPWQMQWVRLGYSMNWNGLFYDFKIDNVAGPPPGFTITATAKGNQLSDGNLTLDSNGTKTPSEKW